MVKHMHDEMNKLTQKFEKAFDDLIPSFPHFSMHNIMQGFDRAFDDMATFSRAHIDIHNKA